MFFWRKDSALIKRAKRRVKSPRAAVFSEFAFIAPVMILLISAMIELCSFWDTKVMANHTAWQVGRIAAVTGPKMVFTEKALQGGEVITTNMPVLIQKALASWNVASKRAARFNNRGGVATMFLMSTCGMGNFGQTLGGNALSALKELFSKPFDKLAEEIRKSILEAIRKKFGFDDKDAEFSLDHPLDALKQLAYKLIESLVNGLFKVIVEPIVKHLTEGVINPFLEWLVKLTHIDDLMGSSNFWARLAYRTGSSVVRMSRFDREVLTVKESDPNAYVSRYRVWGGGGESTKLNYPAVAYDPKCSDGYFVDKPGGWPPKQQKFALVEVDLAWPFEGTWLFPIVSNGRKQQKYDCIRATAKSLVFQQPNIGNGNLSSSTNAVAYDDGNFTNTVDQALGKVNGVGEYMKMALLAYNYRMNCETLSWRDSGDKRDRSTKWIMPLHECYSTDDPVYKKLFKTITDTDDQRSRLHVLGIETSFSKKITKGGYRDFNWLYWPGVNDGPRPRYWWDYGLFSKAGAYSDVADSRPYVTAQPCDQKPLVAGSVQMWTYRIQDGEIVWIQSLDDWYKQIRDIPGYSGIPPPTLPRYSDPDIPAYSKEFNRRFRVNINGLVNVKYEETKAATLIATNKTLIVESKNMRQIARDFKTLVEKSRDELARRINGGSSTMETNPNLVDQKMYEEIKKSDNPVKKAQELWNQQKEKLNKKYNEINQFMDEFNRSFGAYESACSAFASKCDAALPEFRTQLKTVMDRNEAAGVKPEACNAGWKHVRDGFAQYGLSPAFDFEAAQNQFLAEHRKFAKILIRQRDNEREYASLLGLDEAKKPQYSYPIDGKTDWGDPSDPGNIDRRQSSSAPGGDDDGMGEKWTLDPKRGWIKE